MVSLVLLHTLFRQQYKLNYCQVNEDKIEQGNKYRISGGSVRTEFYKYIRKSTRNITCKMSEGVRKQQSLLVCPELISVVQQ